MTLKFKKSYIKNYFTLLGRNEYNVNIKVDKKLEDYYNFEKSIEIAEASFQINSIKGVLKKENLKEKDINVLIGGDLQNQILASNFSARKFSIPFLGLYSACSTFTESLLIGAMLTNMGVDNIIVTTSSHNLVSEKQFRFPIEYGSLKKKINTFTSTGSVSALLTNQKTNIKIESATIGNVIDIGYSDVNNMGAAMTPAAAKTIYDHLNDTNRSVDYYDLILTGDLGIYGINILKDYLKKEYKITKGNFIDAGSILYDTNVTKKIAGGSGPTCLPLVLFSKILKQNYKKILLVGTGSLHSKLSANINESIPAISHAISLEVIKWFT